jgi:hypothetical protein
MLDSDKKSWNFLKLQKWSFHLFNEGPPLAMWQALTFWLMVPKLKSWSKQALILWIMVLKLHSCLINRPFNIWTILNQLNTKRVEF